MIKSRNHIINFLLLCGIFVGLGLAQLHDVVHVLDSHHHPSVESPGEDDVPYSDSKSGEDCLACVLSITATDEQETSAGPDYSISELLHHESNFIGFSSFPPHFYLRAPPVL